MATSNPIVIQLVAQLEEALIEKLQTDDKKRVLDDRVEALIDAVRALHRIYGGELPDVAAKQIDGDLGITDQVREVMKANAAQWQTPMQVRATVEQRGFSLAGYSNPMAVIHQVLKRLEKQGELNSANGGAQYLWKRT